MNVRNSLLALLYSNHAMYQAVCHSFAGLVAYCSTDGNVLQFQVREFPFVQIATYHFILVELHAGFAAHQEGGELLDGLLESVAFVRFHRRVEAEPIPLGILGDEQTELQVIAFDGRRHGFDHLRGEGLHVVVISHRQTPERHARETRQTHRRPLRRRPRRS